LRDIARVGDGDYQDGPDGLAQCHESFDGITHQGRSKSHHSSQNVTEFFT
jgi:hypothetical protein